MAGVMDTMVRVLKSVTGFREVEARAPAACMSLVHGENS